VASNALIEQLRQQLISDEGLKLTPYQDQFGNWTVGVGHLITDGNRSPINIQRANELLIGDINTVLNDCEGQVWYNACDTQDRQCALLNLCFNIGIDKLREFHTFLGLVAQKKWAEAAEDLRHTLWYTQVRHRAERIAFAIEKG
jgi:lysozyme